MRDKVQRENDINGKTNSHVAIHRGQTPPAPTDASHHLISLRVGQSGQTWQYDSWARPTSAEIPALDPSAYIAAVALSFCLCMTPGSICSRRGEVWSWRGRGANIRENPIGQLDKTGLSTINNYSGALFLFASPGCDVSARRGRGDKEKDKAEKRGDAGTWGELNPLSPNLQT